MSSQSRVARWGTVIVAAHAATALAHGWAHRELGVGLNAFQQTFVILVIALAPVVALVLLWAGFPRSGSWVLAGAMAGSLVFGVYHHYVLVSPDHVSHLPVGDARGLFRATAMMLALVAAVGCVVGAAGLSRGRRDRQ